jgi:cyclopropane-fatty-acyl-phospholipid synthase
LFHLEDITSSYVKTLREWRRRFLEQIDRVRALGYSEAFIRAWDFYLTYCEAGFQERYIGDAQMLIVKPRCRREPIVPPLH